METPSRSSASSPDPLSEVGVGLYSGLQNVSSMARRITRSQRSSSMYSLDPRNRMQPSRFSSPRRQTFHLDVGTGLSPQKIRVTVETEESAGEQDDENVQRLDGLEGMGNAETFDRKVSRRLFATAASTPSVPLKPHRQARRSSPSKASASKPSSRKPRTSIATTTKVPLRGLSDDEDATGHTSMATPKPKRGRPRRSGTPMPAGTKSFVDASAATPAATSTPTATRGRRPRAATPKVEAVADLDELASTDATPTLPQRFARRATPKSMADPRRPLAQSTPKTSKRTAASAFAESDNASATDTQPRKRGRGRPRRQAMAPDEMLAIAEHGPEEQHEPDELIEPVELHEPQSQRESSSTPRLADAGEAASVSDSPDPFLDGAFDNTPNSTTFRGVRIAVSPAPTTLSSVDLISVQTPGRPSDPNATLDPAKEQEEEEEDDEDGSGDDEAFAAPSEDYITDDYAADDYAAVDKGDNSYSNDALDDPTPMPADDPTSIPEDDPTHTPADDPTLSTADAPAPIPSDEPVPGLVDNLASTPAGNIDATVQAEHALGNVQIPQLLYHIDNALTETIDSSWTAERTSVHIAAHEHASESERDVVATPYTDVNDAYDDVPVHSEDVLATTPRVGQALRDSFPPSPSIAQQPSASKDVAVATDIGEAHERQVDAASPTIPQEQREATIEASSPNNDLPARNPSPQNRRAIQPHSDDRMQFSGIESPVVHELPISQNNQVARMAQSEATVSSSDSEGDAVPFSSEAYDEAQSATGPVMAEDAEDATSSLRDQDTIARGEDFSMIGMESLRTSFQMSHTALPEMGEMTSRIVSRTLESIRHGNSAIEEKDDRDGLSYLDFLYESNPSTPISAPKSPKKPDAVSSSRSPSPAKDGRAEQHSSPAPKPSSPRKKGESLGKLVALKSLHEAQASAAASYTGPAIDRSTEQHEPAAEYDDSFSAIPDSVLDAAVPEDTNSVYFSRQQADLTGHVFTAPGQASVVEVGDHGGSPVRSRHSSPQSTQMTKLGLDETELPYADTLGDSVNLQHDDGQHEAEVTSSPPVPSASQRYILTQQKRITPVALASPRFPPVARHGGSSDDYLRVPPEGLRPSLSPIVRAGRALQSVTSDPPTPRENEGFLRSPFRSSVARDTQSPVAPAQHDSRTPALRSSEDVPAENDTAGDSPAQNEPGSIVNEPANDELIAEQLFREQSVEADRTASRSDAVEPTPVAIDQDTNAANEKLQTVDDPEADEPAGALESPRVPAVSTQQIPSSASRAAWSMALAPFSGIRNLVAGGVQMLSPRLLSSRSQTASPASSQQASSASVMATPTPAARPRHASSQKRSAEEAQLDEAPSLHKQSPRSKRARLSRNATPLRPHEIAAASGSETGRSWRSYIFRENSVAGSITSFASKLVFHTPQNENNDVETDDAPGDVSIVEPRPNMSVLPSEGNCTEYGSDAIMDMINNISGEGRDVAGNMDSVEAQAFEGHPEMAAPDVPRMTTAIPYNPNSLGQEEDPQGFGLDDDDVDIWAIEAERTTRIPERVPQPALPTKSTPHAPSSAIRDPRLVRIIETGSKRGKQRESAAARLRRQFLADRNTQQRSLLDESDGPEDVSLIDDPPRPTSQFVLDDFFSSPVALPQELPPNSEQNIRFNEQSRQQAMRRYLEHERRSDARKMHPAETTQPVPQAQQPKPTSETPASPELGEHSEVGAPMGRLTHGGQVPASTHVPATLPDEPTSSDERLGVPVSLAVGASPPPSTPSTPSLTHGGRDARTASQEPVPMASTSIIEEEDAMEKLPETPATRTPRTMSRTAQLRKNAIASLRRHAQSTAQLPGSHVPEPTTGSSPPHQASSASSSRPVEPAPRPPVSLGGLSFGLQPPLSSGMGMAGSPQKLGRIRTDPNVGSRAGTEQPGQDGRLRNAALQHALWRPAGSSHIAFVPRTLEPQTRLSESDSTNRQLSLEAQAPRRSLFFGAELNAQARSTDQTHVFPDDKFLSTARSSRANVFFEDEFTSQTPTVEESFGEHMDREAAEAAEAEGYYRVGAGDEFDEGEEDEEDDEVALEREGFDQTYGSSPNGGDLDESSFLTPVLKPLPDKDASPTKSCIRPRTKPKTPGRVVEFTSSTMAAGAGEEIQAERESMNETSLRFAEHFALDTDNRVPAVMTSRTVSADAQPYNDDSDVRMWDRKEVTQNDATMEQERATNRQYEVDQELSDMMLSDSHEISLPRPCLERPRTTPGLGHFVLAENVVHVPWAPPTTIERPPKRDWDLADWVMLSDVLNAYREVGPLNFKLQNMPRRRRTSMTSGSGTPNEQRTLYTLLNKVVHTHAEAMLVKNWHLDIVEVFLLRSGHVWNEHYVVRRLFSLLLGELRHGIFHSGRA